MVPGLIMWLLGVPLVVIILLFVFRITPLLCFAIASVNVILLGPIPSFG